MVIFFNGIVHILGRFGAYFCDQGTLFTSAVNVTGVSPVNKILRTFQYVDVIRVTITFHTSSKGYVWILMDGTTLMNQVWVIFAGNLVRALKLRSLLRHSIMVDSASSLWALAMKMTKETSLDYDSSAKIQWFQVTLGSKAFALALLTPSADLSWSAVLSAILELASTKSP